ncbi:MAG: hypothetical protein ACRC3B_02240, partial [Bacteroidia bacterium]
MKQFITIILLLISTGIFAQDSLQNTSKQKITLVGQEVSREGSIGYYRQITGFKVGDSPHTIKIGYYG